MLLENFTITGTSPSSASTAVVGTAPKGLRRYSHVKMLAELVGATGGVLDVYVQWSPDDGTTWYDYVHFAQLADGATAIKYNCDSAFGATSPTVVGKELTPALASGACVGGNFGTQLRCLCVAGAGTSAGAAVVINIFAS